MNEVYIGVYNIMTYNNKYTFGQASQVVVVVKNLPASAGYTRNRGSIPGSGRSPGGGRGNPLQYSCLENPMDRGAWRAQMTIISTSVGRNPLEEME